MSVPNTISQERNRLAKMAIFFGGLEKVVTTIVSFLRVNLLFRGLGNHDYGLFVTTIGLLGLASQLDLGLHYGVINAVTKARGKDASNEISEIMSSSIALYVAIALIGSLVSILVIWLAPVQWLFNIEQQYVLSAKFALGVGLVLAIFAFPVKSISAVLIGFQRQDLVSGYRTVAAIIQLLSIFPPILLLKNRFLGVALFSSIVDFLFMTCFAIWAKQRFLRHHNLSIRYIAKIRIISLLKSGMTFFITGLGNMFKRTFGNLLVSHYCGPTEVPTFHTTFTLFTNGLIASDLIGGSLWPAFGEAAVRGDWPWVRKIYNQGWRVSMLIGGLLACLGFAFGSDVLKLWVPQLSSPSTTILALFEMWLISQAAISISSNCLCGIHQNTIIMWLALGEGLLSITTGILLGRTFGVEGVVASMTIASTIHMLFLQAFIVPISSNRELPSTLGPLMTLSAIITIFSALGYGLHFLLRNFPILVRLPIGTILLSVGFLGVCFYTILQENDRQFMLRKLHLK